MVSKLDAGDAGTAFLMPRRQRVHGENHKFSGRSPRLTRKSGEIKSTKTQTVGRKKHETTISVISI